ncbi:MAG: hypothetical protein SFV15_20780 [Polyangiaceae bacterium]|nr:hypothetical protein [Polyangiaceae bacterium]
MKKLSVLGLSALMLSISGLAQAATPSPVADTLCDGGKKKKKGEEPAPAPAPEPQPSIFQ